MHRFLTIHIFVTVFTVHVCLPVFAALTVEQLTPREQERYAVVKTDKAAARNFLITREYVRHAQSVLNGVMPPKDLPDKPEGFDERYLFPGEAKQINEAIKKSLIEYVIELESPGKSR